MPTIDSALYTELSLTLLNQEQRTRVDHNLGDESCEVYHPNTQQNLWFCLNSLFRL